MPLILYIEFCPFLLLSLKSTLNDTDLVLPPCVALLQMVLAFTISWIPSGITSINPSYSYKYKEVDSFKI